MREFSARTLRGLKKFAQRAASECRKGLLKAQYPGLVLSGGTFVARGTVIQVGRGASMVIDSCHLSRNSTVVAGTGSSMRVYADYIGPNCTIVARKAVTIGSGSKIAENVVIRDANHDRSAPLSEKRFKPSHVTIGSDVWVGASAVLRAGVTVGDHATVAAGAVVTRDVAAGTAVGGIPARLLHATPTD